MEMAVAAVIAGLSILVWSADRFVTGAAATAQYFGMPPLLIGMVVVGFGTSAPEMLVSALAAMQGSPGIALGNAYGSNIANIALILGVTAVISPIMVHSAVLKKELPILTLVTAGSVWLISDLRISLIDALILLGVFAALMGWTIFQGIRQNTDSLAGQMQARSAESVLLIRRSVFRLIYGLVLLILSSRILVWGAVALAGFFHVSDMIIGLTIVAVGTSLPELASSVIAARRGEHDIALGNVLGSNLFNTLAVVGIAGIIHPVTAEPAVLFRDMPVMGGLTLSLFIIGYGFRGRPGRINRVEGAVLLAVYLGYTLYLIRMAMTGLA
ncbi:MAG: calcium/sodium antiporter [Desulfotignum sp.]